MGAKRKKVDDLNVVGGKRVTLNLVGVDGNAIAIIAAINNQAKREGWTDEERGRFRDAMLNAKDYDHLLVIAVAHTQ